MFDALSSAVAHLDLQNLPGTRLEAARDWSLRFAIATALKFATVARGEVWVTVEDSKPVRLAEGDTFFLTNGAHYAIGSNPDLIPRDGLGIFDWASGGTARLDGDETILVGGAVDVPHGGAPPIFLSMPKFILVERTDPLAGSLRASLSLLAAEAMGAEIGGTAAARRLAEIVVIYALRAAAGHDARNPGIISASTDPYITRALAIMHQDVARHWTVSELARAVGLSRSAFAERFTSKLGSSPLAYLTRQRLDRARSTLLHGEDRVAEVAFAAGYGSESAFGLAFKRHFGISPARFRLQSRAGWDG